MHDYSISSTLAVAKLSDCFIRVCLTNAGIVIPCIIPAKVPQLYYEILVHYVFAFAVWIICG